MDIGKFPTIAQADRARICLEIAIPDAKAELRFNPLAWALAATAKDGFYLIYVGPISLLFIDFPRFMQSRGKESNEITKDFHKWALEDCNEDS